MMYELEKGKVTMVIPLYNKIDAIRRTLDSVLENHGNAPFECVIVDDASTDGSSDIAMEYESKYPDIFTYIRIQHKGKFGPANARNVGIRLCDSEYICFMDADDELIGTHIDRCVGFLEKYPYINTYGESNLIKTISQDGQEKMMRNEADNDIITELMPDILHLTFTSFMFKTTYAKDILFSDIQFEDAIFLHEMLYRHPLFYIDTTKYGIVYNQQYSETLSSHRENIMNESPFIYDYLSKHNIGFPYYVNTYNGDDGYIHWEIKHK